MSVARRRIGLAALAAIAFISIPALISTSASTQSRAAESDLASRAQPLGKPLSTIIEFGEQYETGDVLYDAKITVSKILRGEAAEVLVKSASARNPLPQKTYEYIAARVRFELSARVSPAHDAYMLDPSQFSAIAADGSAYPAANLVAQPKPSVHSTLRSGDSVEGWVVLIVPRGDRTPLMLFVPNTGTTSHTGASSVFRLYGAASLGSGEKSS